MVNYNYAKLIDGRPVFSRLPLVCGEPLTIDGVEHDVGTKVYTSRADVMALFGFTPTIRTKCPGEAGYVYTEEWSEQNGYVVQSWAAEKLPDTAAELADAVEALETLGYNEEVE